MSKCADTRWIGYDLETELPAMATVIRLLLGLGFLMFGLPVAAQADVGLPMIVPMGWLMILALVPIIGVEAWVLSVRLNVGIGAALAASGAANAVSTIIGIPVNWFVGGIAGTI